MLSTTDLQEKCFRRDKKLSSAFGSVGCAHLFCSLIEFCWNIGALPFWSSGTDLKGRKFGRVEKNVGFEDGKTWSLMLSLRGISQEC